jgi:hypothetical protein
MKSRSPLLLASIFVSMMLLSALPLAVFPTVAGEDAPAGPWSMPVRMDDGKHSSRTIGSLGLVQSTDGTLSAAWLDQRFNGTDCMVTASPDGGVEWQRDIRIDPFENQVRQLPTTCDIESDDEGRVYVTYTQWILQQGWWRVRFARSDDGGTTFRDPSDAFFVVDDAMAQEHPEMAISSHGTLNIIYLERTPSSSKIFLVRSDDGLNPLPPRTIEPGMPDNETHVQGDIAMDGDDTVYIAYGYRAPGEAGIKLAKRPAGSGTFTVTKVYTVEEDTPRSLRPQIAVSGDTVEILFDPLEGEGRIYHMRSEDKGATFLTPSKVWTAGDPGDQQTNPDMAFDVLGRLHMAWAQGKDGDTRVYHSMSFDGVSFTAPTPMIGSWNESDLGPRLWEDTPSILPLPDGSVAAAFSASLNRTIGVWFTQMVNQPPVAEITSPDDGAEVRETVYIQGTAQDFGGTTGLEWVYVQVGDGTPKRLAGTTEWEHTFDSIEFPDGLLNISVWATDGFVQGQVATVTVDVDNNKAPTFNLVKPVDEGAYIGKVPVIGTAEDVEGFGESAKVQWRMMDDVSGWVDDETWVLLTDTILDIDFELDLSELPLGSYGIVVRVSDGDKFSQEETRTFDMENLPDLVVRQDWIDAGTGELEHEQMVTITVTVKNEGAGTSGAYELEMWRFNKFVGRTAGSNLSAGESENLIFVWPAVKGDNTLRFVVDPAFLIEELDKTNNEAEIQVSVKEPPEDKDEGTDWIVWISIIIAVVVLVGGGAIAYLKFWSTKPPEGEVVVETVYEGGIYSEGAEQYSGADTAGRDLMTSEGEGTDQMADGSDLGHVESGDRPDLDRPSLDGKDDEQLIQEVEIRTEKVERA